MIQKWSLNHLGIETINASSDRDLLEAVRETITSRTKFSYNERKVIIPRYFYRFIGVEDEESDYYNYLFDLDDKMRQYGKLYLPIKEGLEEKIDRELFHHLNILWSTLLSLPEIKGETIIQLIDQEHLLIDFPNEQLSRQLRGNLQGLIEYYFEIHHHEIDPNHFKQLLFYLISWINLYVGELFMDFDYVNVNPKVLFYGDIAQEEIYFLIYLSSLGCDVLYFNPLRDCDFSIIDKGFFSAKVEFNRKMPVKPFPKKKVVGRASTLAYGASQQITKILSDETGTFFKPWQLIEYQSSSITLKTTYDEVFIIGKEKAMLRPEWKVEKGSVFIPNIFAKVNGVHKNLNKYWKEVYSLMEEKNTLKFKNLPITQPPSKDYLQEYWLTVDNKGYLDEEKMLSSSYWPYKQLPTGMQRRIAHEIAAMCFQKPVMNKTLKNDEKVRIEIFSKLMEVEEKFIKQLQKFDFPQEVPKIVIYNNEDNGDLSFYDTILLKFLNRMGVDIIIFNPAGMNDIENYLEPQYYDIHRLEEVEFNLDFKEKSLFSRFFS